MNDEIHPPTERRRMVCEACGCHTLVQRTLRCGGQCGNCGSYELTPVETVTELRPERASAA